MATMADDILNIDAFTYRYPGAAAPALEGVTCTVRRGECLCLTGDSGSGKTTLLLAAKGLLRGGSRTGAIEVVAPQDGTGFSTPAGIVFQNAETQILCTTVAEEIAFGPENLCVPSADIARRVRTALRDVGLEGCEERNVERFSAGQKQRLAIASVLSMQPSLLLLDEPGSQMDGPGKQGLCDLLARLKGEGYTIVMSEHDPRPFAAIIDRYLILERGRVVALTGTMPAEPVTVYKPRDPVGGAVPPVMTVAGLSLSYPETGMALTDVTFRVRRGERIHIAGVNGAGKSSLLRCLAGLERPDAGEIELAGVGAPRTDRLPGKVGVLFQNPVRQLFAESVFDEVAFTLGRLGLARRDREALTAEALDICGIRHLADRAPLTLSFGEQHRTALAAVVAPKPALLLLDEPFAGLDFPQRLKLLAILGEMPARYGTTVLIASHDGLPDRKWADRTLQLDRGALHEAVP